MNYEKRAPLIKGTGGSILVGLTASAASACAVCSGVNGTMPLALASNCDDYVNLIKECAVECGYYIWMIFFKQLVA